MTVQTKQASLQDTQKEVILRTTGLTKRFGKRTAVNNLNLEVRKGRFLVFWDRTVR